MILNSYRINLEENSDLMQKELAQQHYPKYIIFPCENGHLKKMNI